MFFLFLLQICDAVQALLAAQKSPANLIQQTTSKKLLMPEDQRLTLTIVQKRFPRQRYQKIKWYEVHMSVFVSVRQLKVQQRLL